MDANLLFRPMEPPCPSPYGGVGVELEYMMVHADSLDVYPVADEVIRAATGEYRGDVDDGAVCWSNELALHVIELKSNGAALYFNDLATQFQRAIAELHRLLEPLGGRLMPTGMHPWMDPLVETRLWPHECNAVYEAFNRIFNCRGHGWANLQSIHLNLPFETDEQFGRLHAAIRILLPLLPALAASSPVVNGGLAGPLDNRLKVYRTNCAQVPALTGRLIPEPVFTPEAYRQTILDWIYREIAPHDPEGVLQHEWLNARGAIARFERNTIEIRVLDVQECPRADLAIAQLVSAVLRGLVEERWSTFSAQCTVSTDALEPVLDATIESAGAACIEDPAFLQAVGLTHVRALKAAELWQHFFENTSAEPTGDPEHWRTTMKFLLERGCLAQRIREALGPQPSPERLIRVYRRLSDCLRDDQLFEPEE